MSKKIIICLRCQGVGSVFHSECIDIINCEWEYKSSKCVRCLGSGRLVRHPNNSTFPYLPSKKLKEVENM